MHKIWLAFLQSGFILMQINFTTYLMPCRQEKYMNANDCLGPMPKVTFSAFVMSLASSALVGLGEVADPASGAMGCDMMLAKHNIDVLEMLRQKTLGNLEEQEALLLENLLCDLRLKYVIKCGSQDFAANLATNK